MQAPQESQAQNVLALAPEKAGGVGEAPCVYGAGTALPGVLFSQLGRALPKGTLSAQWMGGKWSQQPENRKKEQMLKPGS